MPNSHKESQNASISPFGDEFDSALIDRLCADYGLTRKRLFFAEHYIITLNGRKAAILAGYASPLVEGSRLLSDANVQQYLSDRFRQLRLSANEVLGRLSDIARGDISDYLKVTKDKASDVPVAIEGKWLEGIYIDLTAAIAAGNTARIKSFRRIRGEVAIELHDPTKALELIGKHHRLFVDVTAHDDRPITNADELSDDELAQIAVNRPDDDDAGGVLNEAAALERTIAALEIEVQSLSPMSSAMNFAQRTLATYRARLAYLNGQTNAAGNAAGDVFGETTEE